MEKRRRITVRYKSANPLFERWLKEWKTEAEEKNSKLQNTYGRALSSLKKCPIKFNSGQECKILKGFGDTLCKMLDNKLKEHNSTYENDDIQTKHTNKESLQPSASQIISSNIQDNKKIAAKKVTQVTENSQVSIVNSNQESSSSSDNTSATSQNSLTITNNIKVTKSKSKIIKQTSSTSENTIEKPQKCKKITEQISDTSEESQDFYIIEPGNFDIILYIDTSETTGNTLRNKSDPLLKELKSISGLCQYEIKKLNVGDYVWICRDKFTKKELVLPYIFERKRLDDFACSIKDGRYKEQKFRLKRSGVENIYYLIENYHRSSLPLATLQQASFNTAIQDGFKIKMTSNLEHTARLLNAFSRLLDRTFERKTLLRCAKENLTPIDLSDDLVSLMSFKDFNQSSLKNKQMRVTDLFVKMLVQIHGMSVQRALALTERFPTPALLKKYYNECDEASGEKLLQDIKCRDRKLGLPLSKIVYQLFNFNKY